MWDYDGLIGKARVYFGRAEAVATAEDDAFAVWLLLGLEFLLRAPLARINPVLLADPNGDAVLHAAGFPGAADAREPKSIQAATVISRLRRVIVDFTADRENDATLLTGLRNRELHSSEAALASIDQSLWLPRFTRVAEILCDHLGLDPVVVVGDEVMQLGRALVDAEDKKLAHEVRDRIADAKRFAEMLNDQERQGRSESVKAAHAWLTILIACPACGYEASPKVEAIRTTNERLEDGEILRDVIYVAKGLMCSFCGLHLTSTAEVKAAGLSQQHKVTETESFEERYLSHYVPDDYGND